MNDFIDEFVSEHADIPAEYALSGSSLRKLIAVYAAQEITAAVQAEREACAKAAEDSPLAFYDTQTRRNIAAAIRARTQEQKS